VIFNLDVPAAIFSTPILNAIPIACHCEMSCHVKVKYVNKLFFL
jgi:hypothetical protein